MNKKDLSKEFEKIINDSFKELNTNYNLNIKYTTSNRGRSIMEVKLIATMIFDDLRKDIKRIKRENAIDNILKNENESIVVEEILKLAPKEDEHVISEVRKMIINELRK